MTVDVRNRQRSVKVNLSKLRKDTGHLLKLLNCDGVEVSILLANDDRIRKLNYEYRNKNTTTDVLSFPMDDSSTGYPYGDTLLGDIVINAHMSRRRANETGNSLHTVIRRLLVHGLLHLVGYDHEKNEYQTRRMSDKEKQLLNALSKLD